MICFINSLKKSFLQFYSKLDPELDSKKIESIVNDAFSLKFINLEKKNLIYVCAKNCNS